MISIRQSTFETNSSSMHSLIVEKNFCIRNFKKSVFIDKPEDIGDYNKFQWEFEKYDSIEDRLFYFLSIYVSIVYSNILDKLRKYRKANNLPKSTQIYNKSTDSFDSLPDNELYKLKPTQDEIEIYNTEINKYYAKVDELFKTLENHKVYLTFDYKKVFTIEYDSSEERYDYAFDKKCFYIDHVSDAYSFARKLLNNKRLLLSWILGKSFIICANDNDDYTKYFKKNLKGIKYPYIRYTKGN